MLKRTGQFCKMNKKNATDKKFILQLFYSSATNKTRMLRVYADNSQMCYMVPL